MSKTLQSCRKAKDFIGYAEQHGGQVVQTNGCVKVFEPKGNGGYATLHANHPKELATGTRAALIKAFIAIGLGVLTPLSCLIAALLSGG
jgi:hypothetical protein